MDRNGVVCVVRYLRVRSSATPDVGQEIWMGWDFSGFSARCGRYDLQKI